MGINKLVGLFIVVTLLSVLPVVSGSVTVVSPASSSVISGTAVLNASGTNLLNCTFYAKSPSTANNTWANLGTFYNSTANAGSINGTFDSSILEDSNDYTFNATCYNSSGSLHEGISTSVTIDNTVPQAPTSLSPTDNTLITSATTQNFSATVVDSNTTGCTYVISRGGATSGNDYITGTASYSGSSCSFTKSFSSQTDNGNWYWYIIASDGSNTTSSSTHLLQVQIPPSGGGTTEVTIPVIDEEKLKNIVIIVIAIIVVIIIVSILKKR